HPQPLRRASPTQATTAAATAARTAGPGRQAEPVHPRQGLRRPCGGPSRHGAVQRRLVGSRYVAVARRDRRTAAMDRPSAVGQLRAAVETFTGTYLKAHLATQDQWCVALSGGPDSLALTAVAAALRPTTAYIVDPGLQPDSAAVAETARAQAIALGCVEAQVLCVQVGSPT